jgi:hypothetical protein
MTDFKENNQKLLLFINMELRFRSKFLNSFEITKQSNTSNSKSDGDNQEHDLKVLTLKYFSSSMV